MDLLWEVFHDHPHARTCLLLALEKLLPHRNLLGSEEHNKEASVALSSLGLWLAGQWLRAYVGPQVRKAGRHPKAPIAPKRLGVIFAVILRTSAMWCCPPVHVMQDLETLHASFTDARESFFRMASSFVFGRGVPVELRSSFAVWPATMEAARVSYKARVERDQDAYGIPERDDEKLPRRVAIWVAQLCAATAGAIMARGPHAP